MRLDTMYSSDGRGCINWYQSPYDSAPEIVGWQSYIGYGGSGSQQEAEAWENQFDPTREAYEETSTYQGSWPRAPPEPPPQAFNSVFGAYGELIDPVLEAGGEQNSSSHGGHSLKQGTPEEQAMSLQEKRIQNLEGNVLQINSCLDQMDGNFERVFEELARIRRDNEVTAIPVVITTQENCSMSPNHQYVSTNPCPILQFEQRIHDNQESRTFQGFNINPVLAQNPYQSHYVSPLDTSPSIHQDLAQPTQNPEHLGTATQPYVQFGMVPQQVSQGLHPIGVSAHPHTGYAQMEEPAMHPYIPTYSIPAQFGSANHTFAQKLNVDLQRLKNECLDKSKHQAELNMEVSTAYFECDSLKQEKEFEGEVKFQKESSPLSETMANSAQEGFAATYGTSVGVAPNQQGYTVQPSPTSSCKVWEQALDSEKVAGMTYSILEATEVWEDNVTTDLQDQNEFISQRDESKFKEALCGFPKISGEDGRMVWDPGIKLILL